MYQHLRNCSVFNYYVMLFTVLDGTTNTAIVNKELHLHNAVIINVEILDKSDK